MPNEKNPVESYSNLGGINIKSSPYITGPMQFLNLVNFDFQTPGSLSQRGGITNFLTVGAGTTQFTGAARVGGFCEMTSGSSEKITVAGMNWSSNFASFGILPWYRIGSSSGSFNMTGISYLNLTQVIQQFYNPGAWNTLGYGTSGFLKSIGNFYLPQYSNVSSVQTDIYGFFNFAWEGNSDYYIQSFALLNNSMYIAGHSYLVKYTGSTLYAFGLPNCVASQWFLFGSGVTIGTLLPISASFAGALGASIGGWSLCLQNGWNYYLYASYVNSTNLEGPITPFGLISLQTTGSSVGTSLMGASIAALIGMSNFIFAGAAINTPSVYDIQYINLYGYQTGQTITTINGGYPNVAAGSTVWNYPYTFIQQFPVNGQTITLIPVGNVANSSTSIIGLSLIDAIAAQDTWNTGPLANGLSYMVFGQTFTISGATAAIQGLNLSEYHDYPRFLCTYQNRLFMAGFDSDRSVVKFSDVGQAEGINPTYNFEVKLNDGDQITCMVTFLSRLYIFKESSIHQLSGTDETNFVLQELTDQYGCISNQGAIVAENTLYFLDKKGLVAFNGGSFDYISLPVQPIFASLFVGGYVKHQSYVGLDHIKNEILVTPYCTNPNFTGYTMTLIYDYVCQAWSTMSPPIGPFGNITNVLGKPTFAFGHQNSTSDSVYYGELIQIYSNGINDVFGTTLPVHIYTEMKSRFHFDGGNSVTKQFRRLFLNIDPLTGSTMAFNVNFYQDYGSSIVYSATFAATSFQTRLDFGIPAKSLSIEVIGATTIAAYKLHGWVLSSRFQRSV